ncbi:unnamed protein product [Spirodela intermedia]|uniref:Uncharacterized protein n=2 Tax=Spirodela intermedia TaxID=51605 RepID=A0A7I8K6I8_SPIIN|nr:unnamed protein product [Spirodela intermedia]CAA6656647.1 unnamed protein product [Spirodela intermedia]CAA7392340.1 unnamed protein product [Spirodela intermedia]
MKSTMINPSIKLLVIALEGQEVSSRRLIDMNLLDEGLEATVVRLEDLHNTTNVRPVGVHSLHSQPQEMSRSDVRQWLDNIGLDALKYPCDDNRVEL